MILDTALAHSVTLIPKTKKALLSMKPQTRRFVFNQDASHKQGRFAMDCMDILCRNAPYVVRPYPNTYIEIDNRAMMEGGYVKPWPDAAEKLGYWWIEDGVCFTVAGNDKHAEFSPFVYTTVHSLLGQKLHEKYEGMDFNNFDVSVSGTDDLAREVAEFYAGDFKKILMLGAIREEHIDQVAKTAPALLNMFDVGMTRKLPDDAIEVFFRETVGTFKFAMSALMLLDDRIKRQLVTVPPQRKIINGKLRTVAKHEVVTIDLDMPTIRHIYANAHHATGTRDHMIEHDVSSHWVYFDTSSQCQHVWVPFYSEDAEKRDKKFGHDQPLRRETCTLCGGRRTRKPSFIAGDPKKGSTVGKKSYRVVASKEKRR